MGYRGETRGRAVAGDTKVWLWECLKGKMCSWEQKGPKSSSAGCGAIIIMIVMCPGE